MLALDVAEDELVHRILERGKSSGRADYSDASIIRSRIAVYHEKTAPLIGYYKAQGKHVPVVGVGGINAIFANLCAAIENL